MSATALPPAAERGATTVSARAVGRIARRAAAEALPGGGTPTGASADVRRGRAVVGLRLALPHPVAVPDVAGRVQRHVTERAAHLTGLSVTRVGVRVDRLETSAAAPAGPPPEGSGGPAVRRRPWSPRGVTAAVTAALGALLCAALLFLTVTAATGTAPDARVARWTARLDDGLAAVQASDTAVLAAGAVVAAAGLWLLVLALTPGARRRARMAGLSGDVRAVLDRRAVRLLLRDAAVDVPGVAAARVRGRRRRARVRATVAFGDLDDRRAELSRALTERVDHLGLVRPPRLRVRVKRDPAWRPPEPEQPADDQPEAEAPEATRPEAEREEPER